VEMKTLFCNLHEGAEAKYPSVVDQTSGLPIAESTSLNSRSKSGALATSVPTAIARPHSR
jgi:hypothetical protein